MSPGRAGHSTTLTGRDGGHPRSGHARTAWWAVAVTAAMLAVLLPAPTASAAYSRFCSSYDSCNNGGKPHYGYKTSKVNAYWRMATGNNCTNYVAYRFVTRTYDRLSNTRPWSGDGNAYSWGRLNPGRTNGTPRVGAVAWWDANRWPAGGFGHVAYVEKVVSSSEVWVSESNWGGTAGGSPPEFGWVKVTSGSGWPSGFIHFKDERILATASPAISGTPKVGVRLTASRGTWRSSSGVAPRATVGYRYQWRANGVYISGATGSTFTPTSAHAGKRISVVVTASGTGYNTGSKASAETAAVAKGDITNTVAPSISGTTRVGETLTAHTGSWSPTPSSYLYQWYADGQPIAGATASTHTLTPDELQAAVSVRVTARRTGYNDRSVTSAATAGVTRGRFVKLSDPSIAGRLRVGEWVRIRTGSWTPDPVEVRYRWYVGGDRVRGQTGRSLYLKRWMAGERVKARFVLVRTGYEPRAKTVWRSGTVRG